MLNVSKINTFKDYIERINTGSIAQIKSKNGEEIAIVGLSYGNESFAIYFHDKKATGKYVLKDEYNLSSLKDLNLVLMFVYKPFYHKVTNVGLNPFETQEEFVELLDDIEIDKELLDNMRSVKSFHRKTSNFEEKKAWTIPVSWKMYGEIDVIADTKEEALEKLQEKIDKIPLPEESCYIDGSFMVFGEDKKKTLDMMKPKFKIIKKH